MPKYCHFEYALVNFGMFSAWLEACACKHADERTVEEQNVEKKVANRRNFWV